MTLTTILVAAIVSILGMSAAWGVQRATGNSGWVDTIWSVTTGLAALAALAAGGLVESPRGALAAALILLWSARLAIHIGTRSHGAAEDPRYAEMIGKWGDQAASKLFWFLQMQAVVAFVLAVSVLAAAGRTDLPIGPFGALAALVALVSLVGEFTADRQMAAFRKANKGRKAVCRDGLWQWSRHPNYFFEWLYWCAWPVMALGAGSLWGAITLAAPLMMYWLLVHVSGIPPLEKSMLASRGDAFRDYQNEVNAFFPGPSRTRAQVEA